MLCMTEAKLGTAASPLLSPWRYQSLKEVLKEHMFCQ